MRWSDRPRRRAVFPCFRALSAARFKISSYGTETLGSQHGAEIRAMFRLPCLDAAPEAWASLGPPGPPELPEASFAVSGSLPDKVSPEGGSKCSTGFMHPSRARKPGCDRRRPAREAGVPRCAVTPCEKIEGLPVTRCDAVFPCEARESRPVVTVLVTMLLHCSMPELERRSIAIVGPGDRRHEFGSPTIGLKRTTGLKPQAPPGSLVQIEGALWTVPKQLATVQVREPAVLSEYFNCAKCDRCRSPRSVLRPAPPPPRGESAAIHDG